MSARTVIVLACLALVGCFDQEAVEAEAEALEERISASVEERLAALEAENLAQAQTITGLQETLDALEAENDAQAQTITGIQETLDALATEDLASRVAAVEVAVGIPYDPAADLDTRVATLEDAGFVTDETDPDFAASAASGIASVDIAHWNSAFGWGDHVAAGYLTSYTETDPVATAALEELELCPAGWVHDPTETAFTLCYDPDSALGADEMVKVGDFWVDRYEASAWESEDCSGDQYGETTTDDYPDPDFPDTGNWSAQVFACSVPGVTPSRSLTWFQAQQACAASGKDLCADEQWQAAAAGTWDPGASPSGFQCNTSSGGPRATGMAGSLPSHASSCISAWGAEDMVGNLWEWTADWYQAGRGGWMGSIDGSFISPWPSSYGDDRTWNLDGRAYDGSAWKDGLPAAGRRGGAWGHGASAGVFALYLNNGPSSRNTDVGFRCCRRR